MADAFTPNFNLTLPEVGASFDTWGTKLNADLSVVDKHLVPVGAILMWSGAVVDIPNNWALCDGANGTPDLRDRFIVGAGSTYAPDAVGGSNSVTLAVDHIPVHNHTGSTAGAGGHTHTASSAGAGGHDHGGATGGAGAHSHSASISNDTHTHNVRFRTTAGSDGTGYFGTTDGSLTQRGSSNASATQSLDSDTHSHSASISSVSNHAHTINTVANHTHTITVDAVADHTHAVTIENTGGGESHENRPPFYALAYIMCIG